MTDYIPDKNAQKDHMFNNAKMRHSNTRRDASHYSHTGDASTDSPASRRLAPAPSAPLWSRDWVTPTPTPTHLRIKRGDPTAFRTATPFHLLMSLFFMHLLSLEFICCSGLFTLKICVFSRAYTKTQCFNIALRVFSFSDLLLSLTSELMSFFWIFVQTFNSLIFLDKC